MYLALHTTSAPSDIGRENRVDLLQCADLPFGWIPFLFYLCEDTVCLIVDAVRALGHLPVALDLLLPAHVACLMWGIKISLLWT